MRRTTSILLVVLAAPACTWRPPGPVVTAVEPALAAADVDTAVVVRGESFLPAVRADVDHPDRSEVVAGFALELAGSGGGRVALVDVTLVSDRELRATLPAGAAADTYDLQLLDPRGRSAVLADALAVYVPGCAGEGAPCDDGDACTVGDACRGGACVGGSAVVCAALDACHVAGTCDPGTGLCSDPVAPDGTACDDGSRCTQVDACASGVCVGSSPVACAALDGCHVAGACEPTTGLCSDPPAPDGTACRSACAAGETCRAGACTPPPGGCLLSAPLARLVVTPLVLTTGAPATFDASDSSDPDEPKSALVAEFDFEGSGTFSSPQPATQPATHAFAAAGSYTAWVRVTDSSGLASYASALVVVVDAADLVVVTTVADESDPNATPESPGGTGLSLREAVTYVNARAAPRTITFAGPLAVTLTQPQRGLTLTAPGAAVVGGPGVTVDFGGYNQACFRLTAAGERLVAVAVRGCNSAFVQLLPGSAGARVAYCDVGPGASARGIDAANDSPPNGPPASVIGPGNLIAGVGVGIWIEGTDYVVTGNRVTGNATGIELNGVRSRIVGNAISGQVTGAPGTGNGLRIYNGAGTVEVWHNAIHGNARDGLQSDVVPLDVRNNLFTANAGYGVRAQASSFAPAAFGWNGYWANALGAVTRTPLVTGATDVLADPLYVDAPGADFRLQPGSPAIDAGAPIPGLDVNGPAPGLFDHLAPDLGLAETPY